MSPNASISIKNLKKHYPQVKGYRELFLHPLREKRVTALDGIDLEIGTGECFFLLGPNGAGKTTLIKILATLILPDSGNVYINDLDVEKEPEKIKPLVGYAINEERSFFWRLTGRQNLEFYAALNNIPSRKIKNTIDKVLDITDLGRVADDPFNTYSTGMRQMFCIARALLTDPNVLLVDEPTRSLDPQAAARIRKFLKEELAKRERHTIIWASHDLHEATEYGHSLAIINKGQIKKKGQVKELTDRGRIKMHEIYDQTLEN